MIGASRKGRCERVICSAAMLLALSMATTAVVDMPPSVVDGRNHDALSARGGFGDEVRLLFSCDPDGGR